MSGQGTEQSIAGRPQEDEILRLIDPHVAGSHNLGLSYGDLGITPGGKPNREIVH